jgi:Na+/melibiose symporter-like transporter
MADHQPVQSVGSGAGGDPGPKTYHCGTLTYTKLGLIGLFAWLLWGDFCFTLMEAVEPSILPLKLKSLGCSNWLLGLIMTSAPGVLNMTICPYISFKSDRFRSRWGRRIPFIVATMPFLCLSLALIGWSEEITALMVAHSGYLKSFAPTTVTIAVIAVFVLMFQFFNMFVGSVFYYLFNDVVPPQFLGRFFGAFKIVGTSASAIFNFFIFKYAESHMREIFTGAAILYFVGFTVMCFMIKEGSYPAITLEKAKENKGFAGLKTFFRESFGDWFYWLIFLSTTSAASVGCMRTFNVFFNKDMGLTLDQIGKLGAIGGVVSIAAVYFFSVFIDRWHPLRITVYLSVFTVIGAFMAWVWIFVSLPGTVFFWLSLGGVLIGAFQAGLSGAGNMPLYMRVFPQSRFGQFCSAQSLIRSFCVIFFSVLAGLYIDVVRHYCNGSDAAYRYIFLWSTLFYLAHAGCLVFAYLRWHQLGGDTHFHPPASWNPNKVEEIPIVTTVGPQARWLMYALRFFDGIMALSAFGIPCLMVWMNHEGMMTAFRWHAWLLLPLSLGIWAYWGFVRKSIVRDMARVRAHEPLRNGIPHHGVLLVMSIKYLVVQCIWVCQVVVTVNMKLESSAIVFTLASLIVDVMLVGAVHLLCRIERGNSTTLDVNLSEAAP